MSDFAIVSELIETTVTKRRIRSPGIHFSNSVSGEQFISVDLTEVKEVNNEKQKSECEITKLTEKITYTQEDLNKVREWN